MSTKSLICLIARQVKSSLIHKKFDRLLLYIITKLVFAPCSNLKAATPEVWNLDRHHVTYDTWNAYSQLHNNKNC